MGEKQRMGAEAFMNREDRISDKIIRLIEDEEPINLSELEHGFPLTESFEAQVRYLSASAIVTVPAKIVRKLGIELGDKVSIQIQKKEERSQ